MPCANQKPPYRDRLALRFRRLCLTGALLVQLTVAGCSMCCGPHDYEYPMLQSRYARTDPEHGRVGSIFSDSSVSVGTAPQSNADRPPDDGINRPGETTNPDDPNFEKDPFLGDEPEDGEDTASRFIFPSRR